ncbi:MAG: porphobilinogen synthase [Chloroflexi bacterium]|nr:porphobilinogen synthase [Chloroflexota bacterium]
MTHLTAGSVALTASTAAQPRRLRLSPAIRTMVRETSLSAGDFIYPLFVTHGHSLKREVASMPGVFQWSPDLLAAEAESIARLGIPAVLLFGIPDHKDATGTESCAPDGAVQQAVRIIKQAVPDMVVITDVCLCEYTDHGHCGVLNTGGDHRRPYPQLPEGYVLNAETLEILADVAVSHAEAGADIVAPSGMMDGMVRAIRTGLDTRGFEHLAILSYSTKYASAFYGPFRDAAQGVPKFGDRRSHQMDPANAREALRETALDVAEGADMLMVKPALAYLDIIRMIRERFEALPLVAYNVSGEYAMIKAAAANGWLNERQTALETLTSIKRAGADLIITYHAKEAAQWLK